jgi:DNA-binding transcriptional ArsR family regulator
MEEHQYARLEARAKIIKALSHPTRLFMVEELAKGQRCVSELTEMIEADVSTVSKHLSVLSNVGIVRHEKHGNQVYYHLETPCILNFFGCVEAVMESTAREKAALVKP